MAHEVFISYSSRDRLTADAVCATLESRGIRCWIAPRDVLGGERYGEALVRALRNSRLMVLVFSATANQSQQVLSEVERAVSKGLPIIPLRIEDVQPSDEMEYYISSRHWLDALTPPLEEHLLRLAETASFLLSRGADSVVPQPAKHGASQSSLRPPSVADAPGSEVAESAGPHGPQPRSPEGPPNWPQGAVEPPQATSDKSVHSAEVVIVPTYPFPPEILSREPSPEPKKLPVRRIWLLSTVGGAIGLMVLVAMVFPWNRHGAILEPRYAGEHWIARNSGTLNDLQSIFGTSDGKRLWAVGGDGTIVRSDDGEHWIQGSSSARDYLCSVTGTGDGKRLLALNCNTGVILDSDDYGEHWIRGKSGTGYNGNSYGVDSIFVTNDGKRFWAVGRKGTIVESDGSDNWIRRDSGTSNDLHSIFGTGDGKCLWAVGDRGTIVKSDDGEHWITVDSGTTYPLFSIFGTADGKRLWAVGGDGAIVRSDDGEHWIARNPVTADSLLSISGTSDGKRLWAVGQEGTIAESDGGDNWIRRNSGTSNYLVSLFVANDGKQVWAVGGTGTIVESDNGEHYNARSSWTPNNSSSNIGIGDTMRITTMLEGMLELNQCQSLSRASDSKRECY
jgi:photosystem II stability/assembly factor-like uncharacterized protein